MKSRLIIIAAALLVTIAAVAQKRRVVENPTLSAKVGLTCCKSMS